MMRFGAQNGSVCGKRENKTDPNKTDPHAVQGMRV